MIVLEVQNISKKLRMRDRLLLGLSISTDHILPALIAAGRGRAPRSAPSWLPPKYKKENFYNLTSRLFRVGYIEKVIKNGRPYLRLANKGKKILKRDFSLLRMQKKKWNRKWCLVVFDFPETDRKVRDRLREKLIYLGFGKLQRSIYISPYNYAHDLAEFLSDQKILGYAFVLTSRHELMGDPQDLAARVWPLEELNEAYEKILDRLEEINPQDLQTVQKIKSDYLELLLEDPFLPKQLLPPNWAGEEVRKKITS